MREGFSDAIKQDGAGISMDALVFGLAYLRGPNCKLSFGGEGATMRITDRARAALTELLAAGYAEVAKPDDQIIGREHYRGTGTDPHLGLIGQQQGLDPFNLDSWSTFTKIEGLDKGRVRLSSGGDA